MRPTSGDISLFMCAIQGAVEGMVGIYVDDSLATGEEELEEKRKLSQAKFESRERV